MEQEPAGNGLGVFSSASGFYGLAICGGRPGWLKGFAKEISGAGANLGKQTWSGYSGPRSVYAFGRAGRCVYVGSSRFGIGGAINRLRTHMENKRMVEGDLVFVAESPLLWRAEVAVRVLAPKKIRGAVGTPEEHALNAVLSPSINQEYDTIGMGFAVELLKNLVSEGVARPERKCPKCPPVKDPAPARATDTLYSRPADLLWSEVFGNGFFTVHGNFERAPPGDGFVLVRSSEIAWYRARVAASPPRDVTAQPAPTP